MSIVGAIRRMIASGLSIGQALLAAEAFEAEAQAAGGRDHYCSVVDGRDDRRARISHAERQRRYRERKRGPAQDVPARDARIDLDASHGRDVTSVTPVTRSDVDSVTRDARVTPRDADTVTRDAKVTLCDAETVTRDARVTACDASRDAGAVAHRDNYAGARGFPVGLSYESPPLDSPLPSEGPHPEKPKRQGGTCLPENWTPGEELFAYGQQQGLSRERTAASLEDMRLWAIANRNRAIARKADWTATAKGFIRRDAQKALARAGPQKPVRRNPFLVDYERELSEQHYAEDWENHHARGAAPRAVASGAIDLRGGEYRVVD